MLNASVVNDEYLARAREHGVDFDKIALTYNKLILAYPGTGSKSAI